MMHRKDDIENLLRSSLQSMDSVGVVSIQDDTTVGSLSLSTPSLVDSTTNLCETKSHHKTKSKRIKKETRVHNHAQLNSVDKFGGNVWNSQHQHYGNNTGTEENTTAGTTKKGDRTFFVGMGILFSIFAVTAAFLLIILPCYRMLNLNALLHSTTNGSMFQRHLDNGLRHPEQDIKSHELPPGHRLLYQPVRSPLCDISDNKKKFDCFPDYHGVNQRSCWSRGCCWRPTMDSYFYRDEDAKVRGVPACFLPANYSGYRVTKVDQSRTGATLELLKSSASLAWPREIRLLKVGVTFDSPYRLHFKIFDPQERRYEVPLNVHKPSRLTDISDCDYTVSYVKEPFGLIVRRKSTNTIIFNSAKAAPLIFADQYIQIGTVLASKYLYGLGEHQDKFLIDINWTSRGFWARDQAPRVNTNLYGVHPFYMNIDKHGNAYGVFLLNSNAMQVDFQPLPALTYRTMGGVLDFYIFTGPSPIDVIQQYTELIGRPYFPPYWALGFHLCRWGYENSRNLKEVIKRMRDSKIPYDVQWNDIDYMDRHLDWTYNTKNFAELPEIVEDLHAHGQHYIMIVDPGISNQQREGTYPPYDKGLKEGIFITDSKGGKPIVGRVWPGDTVFPDFFHPKAFSYWHDLAEKFHKQIPFDGLWVDMNEPSNFVSGSEDGCLYNSLNYPPFSSPAILGSKLFEQTLCPSAHQNLSSHYNLHNMYGYSETKITAMSLEKILRKRTLVISRSTFPGSGVYGGHWSGDNHANWDHLYYSIPEILNFQLFGIPMVGSDVCGFAGPTNAELCTRWTQLGAFYPFMRNHNNLHMPDQDPAVFDEHIQNAMRQVLLIRYSLLPYLYTLFYNSHINGTPVLWPLFFLEPNEETFTIDQQFLWGNGLMISPVVRPSTFEVKAYFPEGSWYDFYTGTKIGSTGLYMILDAPWDKINLHVRGGTILPIIEPDVTTTASRKKKFGLFVAPDTQGKSKGELFWDDGVSLDSIKSGKFTHLIFMATEQNVTSQVLRSGYTLAAGMYLGHAIICGVQKCPSHATANGKPVKFQCESTSQILNITNIALSLHHPLNISWV